ncbi:MAG: hypothetical protein Q8R16_03160, partial [bacterium]|nr:hypothetical protein [bacterium]
KAAEGAFVDLHKPPVDSEVDYVARLSLTQEQERLRQGGGESETAYLRETLQQWASGDAQYERSRREDIFPGWAPEDFQRALQARDRARQAPASAPQQEGPIARARRWLRKLKS